MAVSQSHIFYRFFLITSGAGFIFLLSVSFLGFGGLLLSLYSYRHISWLQKPVLAAVNTFFPLVLILARFVNIEQEKVKCSFIEVNNQLVHLRNVEVKARNILILVPHCLQKNTCPHNIITNTANCGRCGACSFRKILEISEDYGVGLAVVTGGTLARRFVKKFRPQAIIAVACEHDLASGIQDVYPLPVWGVINLRPEGPCVNTCVDLRMVEEAVTYFLGYNDEHDSKPDTKHMVRGYYGKDIS